MDIYFAAVNDIQILHDFYKHTGKKINVMLSFHELNGKVLETINNYAPYVKKFMLDSGAFSVYSKPALLKSLKQKFPLYLKNHKDDLEQYCEAVFNLDYMSGEDEKSRTANLSMYIDIRKNYEKITPVIHSIEKDNKELDEYEYDKPVTIGIGQNKKRKSKDYRPLLQSTVNRIKTNSKCHLLGITDYEILDDVPNIDSCDSKSWLDYAVSGKVLFNRFDGNKLRQRTIYFPNFVDKATKGKEVAFDEMEQTDRESFLGVMNRVFKLTKDDFLNTNQLHSRMLANIYYELQKIAYINNKHNPNLQTK